LWGRDVCWVSKMSEFYSGVLFLRHQFTYFPMIHFSRILRQLTWLGNWSRVPLGHFACWRSSTLNDSHLILLRHLFSGYWCSTICTVFSYWMAVHYPARDDSGLIRHGEVHVITKEAIWHSCRSGTQLCELIRVSHISAKCNTDSTRHCQLLRYNKNLNLRYCIIKTAF